MRGLFSLLANKARPLSSRASRGRPESIRRRTLAVNARVILVVSVAALPFALIALLQGMLLPFVLGMLGLAVGCLTLALHQRGQFERAAAGQVYGVSLAGLILAVADPAIADFGLATALLAPVHASLLTRTPVKKRAWLALVVVAAFAAASSSGVLAWPEAYRPEYSLTAALAFTVVAAIVAYSGSRLNSVFQVYDKSQINAYRHLIEHVRDAVMRFSTGGSLIFASKSAEKLFGCRRYELSGDGLLERIHLLDRPICLTAFAEANQDGKARTFEVRMRRDDPDAPTAAPSYAWIEVALSPVIDEELPPGRYEVVALLRDVTDRKDQENAIREAHKLAEEASMAKSRFLAMIGHELRTPLNAIVGFSEMMTSGVTGELSPAHKEYAQLIHQSGNHLIEVVRMLLDMSRIEAGRFELQTESFQPEGLIDPCLRMVDSMAAERKIRVVTDLPATLPPLVADERVCRQILINLLSNAIKFSHEASEVAVSMKRQGPYLNISVTDRGVGMDEEAVRRVGEPFFQAQGGLARRYEGTGLGLSIVKGLVELHDGTLHAASSPGQGTTMTVLLPINGPAIKLEETTEVTPLHREPAQQPMQQWPDERKRAL